MLKKGLGRGLGALLDGGDKKDGMDIQDSHQHKTGGAIEVDIRKIEPNLRQPRQYFDDASLAELAESIRSFGIIQPLIVRDCGDHYAIIAGERRFRAARIAKLETLPVVVKDCTEMETLQIALIENIQRQDLTPVEEAACYKRLMEDFFFTPEDIAEKVGKHKHSIVGLVRLLELDERALRLAGEGKLTASHAQVLLSVRDGDLQYACAQRIVEEALSVRAAEALVRSALAKAEAAPSAEATQSDPLENRLPEGFAQAFRRAEEEMKALLGAKVNIRHNQHKNNGKIEIAYYSPEELDRLLGLFKRTQDG